RGQRRSIINAVTDLADLQAILPQRADDAALVLRQKLRAHLDAEITSHKLGRTGVVARKHEGADALFLELSKAGPCVRPRLVPQRNGADGDAVRKQHRDRVSLGLQRGQGLCLLRRDLPSPGGGADGTEEEKPALNDRRDALPADGGSLRDRREGESLLACPGQDG